MNEEITQNMNTHIRVYTCMHCKHAHLCVGVCEMVSCSSILYFLLDSAISIIMTFAISEGGQNSLYAPTWEKLDRCA